MPSTPVQVYRTDRRNLLKMAGAVGVGALAFNATDLLAADVCELIAPKLPTDLSKLGAGVDLQYWIDGLHVVGQSNLKSRANVAVFMDLKQEPTSYVESVVLVDSQKKILGARYFDASIKMSDGRVPYVIFENVELDSAQDYMVYFNKRVGSDAIIYAGTIAKPKLSTMNERFLPDQIKRDLSVFLLGNAANPTPGLITSHYQFYTLNRLNAHSAKAKVWDIGSDGSFQINIAFMHPDADDNHFMRYFLVLDPVGRMLGFHKRAGRTDPTSNGGPANTWTVSKVSAQQTLDFGVSPLQIANIKDCPYVQIYTEDCFDAIARTTLRLR